MRRDVAERVRALERKFVDPNIPIDFLGVWNPHDSDWETVKLEGQVPEYLKRLTIQRNKATGELRGLFNDNSIYPPGAEVRFL